MTIKVTTLYTFILLIILLIIASILINLPDIGVLPPIKYKTKLNSAPMDRSRKMPFIRQGDIRIFAFPNSPPNVMNLTADIIIREDMLSKCFAILTADKPVPGFIELTDLLYKEEGNSGLLLLRFDTHINKTGSDISLAKLLIQKWLDIGYLEIYKIIFTENSITYIPYPRSELKLNYGSNCKLVKFGVEHRINLKIIQNRLQKNVVFYNTDFGKCYTMISDLQEKVLIAKGIGPILFFATPDISKSALDDTDLSRVCTNNILPKSALLKRIIYYKLKLRSKSYCEYLNSDYIAKIHGKLHLVND